jgi:Glycosyltransferase family 87
MLAALEARLTRQNLMTVAILLPLVALVAECYVVWSDPSLRWRMVIGHDFLAFWSSAVLYLQDGIPALYDYAAQNALQQEHAVGPGVLLWYYPPTWLMVSLPFGLMPFPLAALLFAALSVLAAILLARLIRPEAGPAGLAATLGAPVIIAALIQGQNGILVALLMTAGIIAVDRGRPWLSAILLAALLIKPHLAVLIPLALLATRNWSQIARTGLATLAIVALTAAIIGPEGWRAFLAHLGDAELALRDPDLLVQNPSGFAFAILLDLPRWMALFLQGASASVAVLAVLTIWRNSSNADLRLAALATGSAMISPYVFRYDLVLLLVTTLLLARIALKDGWLKGERLHLALLWTFPALFPPIAIATHIQLGFPLLLLALALVWRRFRATSALPLPHLT